jgi:hypothetical protein
MTPEDFVTALFEQVHVSGVSDMESGLEKPPGRKPNPNTVKLAEWYVSLPLADKKFVRQVIEHSIHTAIFGTLCVIDGVRCIEDADERGEIELQFNKGGERTRLNDTNKDFLHDIYQGLSYERVFNPKT